jgi:hypothetical protein
LAVNSFTNTSLPPVSTRGKEFLPPNRVGKLVYQSISDKIPGIKSAFNPRECKTWLVFLPTTAIFTVAKALASFPQNVKRSKKKLTALAEVKISQSNSFN